VCEFLPGYLWDEKERERLDLRVTTVDVRRGRLGADRERVRRMIQGEESIPTWRSREDISAIMVATWTGEDSVNIVNLPNAGQVRDLPLGPSSRPTARSTARVLLASFSGSYPHR
jgi:alpha-galactosidase/6-phospho-beta-glucosidase family protein